MTSRFVRLLLVIFIINFILVACGDSDDNVDGSPIDSELRDIIESLGLTGDPSKGHDLPSIDTPVAQLGMKLFYTKALGGDKDTACVSCHHPVLGGGDGMSLPVGAGAEVPDLLGPGRKHSTSAEGFDGGPTVPRNAPTTYNIGLWDEVLFLDGRIESLGKTPDVNGNDGLGISTPDSSYNVADSLAGQNLPQAQSRFPVVSNEEMRGFTFEANMENEIVREHLAQRIGNYGKGTGELVFNNWLYEFQKAFNIYEDAETLVTFDRIAFALGEFERSQVFVETPWKAYVNGDNSAITEEAKRGALFFFKSPRDGGAGCVACHKGDFFTDEKFYVLALPQIGRGKGNGETGDDDFGRFNITNADNDLYAFRTPSLLNVEMTAPYGHAGSYTTLEGLVRHILNPEKAIDEYDFTQLDPAIQTESAVANTHKALERLLFNRANGIPTVQNVEFTDNDVNDLVAFLLTLTDPCVKKRECLSPWIPDETVSDPDSQRLNGINSYGDLL